MALMVTLVVTPVPAETLRVEFAGAVTSTHIIDVVGAGAPVSGWFEFDPAAKDANPSDPAVGLYPAVSAASVTVGGHEYAAQRGVLTVMNDGVLDPNRPKPMDLYGLNAGPPLTGDALSGLPPFQLEINLGDTTASAFSDDHLPRDPDGARFDITALGPTRTLGGRLHFKSAATGQIGVVQFRVDRLQRPR
jgi:hypothetical protein